MSGARAHWPLLAIARSSLRCAMCDALRPFLLRLRLPQKWAQCRGETASRTGSTVVWVKGPAERGGVARVRVAVCLWVRCVAWGRVSIGRGDRATVVKTKVSVYGTA